MGNKKSHPRRKPRCAKNVKKCLDKLKAEGRITYVAGPLEAVVQPPQGVSQ